MANVREVIGSENDGQMSFWRLILAITLYVTRVAVKIWLKSIGVLWGAAFLYSMFYCIYLPMISTFKEIHFQFDSTCDVETSGRCGNPYANVSLADSSPKTSIYLARGQLYRFGVELLLPESDINWSQGMFMIRLKLYDAMRRTVVDTARPAILQYKSPLLRLFNTIFWWPLLVFNMMEESQLLTVTLMDNFREGSYENVGPVTDVSIEIEARQIQIYSPSTLLIEAQLTGLRYYMYTYPLTSTVMGVSTIAFFLFIPIFFTFTTTEKGDENSDDLFNDDVNYSGFDENTPIKEITESDFKLRKINQDFDEQNPLPDSSVN